MKNNKRNKNASMLFILFGLCASSALWAANPSASFTVNATVQDTDDIYCGSATHCSSLNADFGTLAASALVNGTVPPVDVDATIGTDSAVDAVYFSVNPSTGSAFALTSQAVGATPIPYTVSYFDCTNTEHTVSPGTAGISLLASQASITGGSSAPCAQYATATPTGSTGYGKFHLAIPATSTTPVAGIYTQTLTVTVCGTSGTCAP